MQFKNRLTDGVYNKGIQITPNQKMSQSFLYYELYQNSKTLRHSHLKNYSIYVNLTQ